jgi:phosphotransacetylase
MTEKTELPEVCIQYDMFYDTVIDHESNIEELKAENEKLKDELKEAIILVKDAQEIGETSEYFRTRIKEIDLTLIQNDADIKAKQESLFGHTKRRNELAEKCRAAGMHKIQIGLLDNDIWVTTEELESQYKNVLWYSRIV